MGNPDGYRLSVEKRSGDLGSRPSPRSPRVLNSRLIAIALACLMGALLWTSIAQSHDPVQNNLSLEPLPDGAQRVTWVVPGSAYWDPGLRPGDIVREVPVPPDARQTPRPVAAYAVIAGAQAPRTVLIRRGWSEIEDLGLFALALEFFSAGILVFLKASDRSPTRRFLLLSVACAVVLVTGPVTGTGRDWALYTAWVATMVMAVAFVLFFLAFPTSRWRPFRIGFAAALAPLVGLYLYTVAFDPALYDTVKLVGFAYLAVGSGISVAHLAWPFVARRGRARERRYLLPIAASVGLAVGTFLVGSILPYLLTREYVVPPTLSVLTWALVPVGFVWSIFRYRLMGIDLGDYAILRAVFEDSNDQVFLVDHDGQLRDASRTARELLAELDFSRPDDDFHALVRSWEPAPGQGASSASPAVDVLTAALRGQRVVDHAQVVTMPDGTTRDMSVSASPIADHRGEVDLVVLTYRDLTKRAEAQRVWAEHLATISHDLRSPLATLKMQADLLASSPDVGSSPDLRRGLARLRSSSRYLNCLLTDLIQSIRLDSGLAAISPRTVQLRELLEEVVQHSVGNGRDESRVTLEVADDLPPLLADPILLERVFGNLIENALNYTPPEAAVRVRAGIADGEARVVVSDEGPGISPADLPRLFERRYRGATSSGTQGTGLGLYIAREAVRLHGGRIWAESAPGRGAAFHVALPLPERPTSPR